ncbi:hypothetical protein H8E88_27340 [candidate division KSB1 bacterium]|nr:hypothetical protein [candidate division KSB1 bacterium]
MLIGVLFSMAYPKGDRRRDKATYVFIFSAAALMASWLLERGDLVQTLQENIGFVLLGLVITFLKLVLK